MITASDAGCWVDGHWGWRGSHRVVEIAQSFGLWSNEEIDEDHEFIFELADEAEQWLNENVVPEGYAFGWYDGEFFLWSIEDWEEAY